MAEKKPETTEKIYIIPLRRVWVDVPRVTKTRRSVSAVRDYVAKHTHASEVKISEKLNRTLWAGGAKKPLSKIRVKVVITEGAADVRLPEEITLEEEKKKFLEKAKEKKAGKAGKEDAAKAEEKKEEAPAEKTEPAKEGAEPAENKEEKPAEGPKAEKK